MTPAKKPPRGISAADLMAQLQGDQGYQERMRAAEAQRQVVVAQLSRAEQPIVADLRAAGFAVTSVWDLVNTSTPYHAALPVLLHHLRAGGYPDRVMEGLASALAVRPSAPFWPHLRELYLAAQGRGETEGLAVALAAAATPDHLEAMVELLNRADRADTRIHLLRAILRVGGERGVEVLHGLEQDPVFGREARALLGAHRSGGS